MRNVKDYKVTRCSKFMKSYIGQKKFHGGIVFYYADGHSVTSLFYTNGELNSMAHIKGPEFSEAKKNLTPSDQGAPNTTKSEDTTEKTD